MQGKKGEKSKSGEEKGKDADKAALVDASSSQLRD